MNILGSKRDVILLTIANIFFFSLSLVIGFVNFAIFKDDPTGVFANVVHIANASCLISLLFLTVIEIGSNFFDKSAVWYTTGIAAAILLTVYFSNDTNLMIQSMVLSLNNDYTLYASQILCYMCFIAGLIFFMYFFNHDYPIFFLKVEKVSSIVILALSGVAYDILVFFNYAFFAIIPVVLLSVYWYIRFCYNVYRKNGFTLTFAYSSVIFTLFVSIMVGEAITNSSDYMFNSFGVTSFYAIAMIILFFLIYLDYILRTTRRADASVIYEKRLNELQASILKNQINPHFIFNALNVIKSQYLISNARGDAAMDIFSKHLRAYVEAGDKFLVPLSKEIDNLNSYLEILNLSSDNKFTVYYDIESFDFEVPYFSLQPIIENAYKYSQIQFKDNGYLRIVTNEDDDFYHILVIDNGVGFDVNTIKNTSTGIKNSKDRFKLLLNANFEIDSKIGEGTKVIIDIPKKK